MSLISDETAALRIENEAGWLPAGREGYIHGPLGRHLVDVTVCRDRVQVSLLILSRAVERDGKLE